MTIETIDEHFVRVVQSMATGAATPRADSNPHLRDLFEAQLQSRHLDFAARWLQSQGRGYYTIGSAGHEGNAAVGLLSRPTDPALLHYRSGGFYAARAASSGHTEAIRDVLLALTSSVRDPISGGRHKVFGHPRLNIIPQTSTIASHLPRAVGLAFALDHPQPTSDEGRWPEDAVVICSFGDASANHSTATGAINAAAYLNHRNLPCPILFVCEDNGIGISTPSPHGWPEAALTRIPGVPFWKADSSDPVALLQLVEEALEAVRSGRRPGMLLMRTVRFLGHAGSDVESAYRSRKEIAEDYSLDPLLRAAQALIGAGALTPSDVLNRYREVGDGVMQQARAVVDERRLASRAAVVAPLQLPQRTPRPSRQTSANRLTVWGAKPPESVSPLTLAQSITATLADLMIADPGVLVFGEDVAIKGGVYGVTRGLRKRFGGHRVFDTLLDEQTVLGTALGSALAGYVPIPEIQYLAYLHNAEDQIRGEAASLRFFSNDQYRNGMVVRIAGLAYQRGFGGHFHNDNSVAVLRDIPGIVLAVPSHPADAVGMLRTCYSLAKNEGAVCVYLEPIARYHTRDLLVEGDGLWTAAYLPPDRETGDHSLDDLVVHGSGRDLLMVTFGNGVYLSRRAQEELRREGIDCTVADLRWLTPLPAGALTRLVDQFRAVLVVDETRSSGGVAEGVVSALVDTKFEGALGRVTSADSFIPLGPAADTVLLTENDIVHAARTLARSTNRAGLHTKGQP